MNTVIVSGCPTTATTASVFGKQQSAHLNVGELLVQAEVLQVGVSRISFHMEMTYRSTRHLNEPYAERQCGVRAASASASISDCPVDLQDA